MVTGADSGGGDPERRLRQYRQVAESQNDVSFITDEGGRIEFIVERVSDLLGWDRADVLGERATDLLDRIATDSGDVAAFEESVEAVLGGRSQASVTVTTDLGPRGERSIDVRLTPFQPDGDVEGVVGIAHDVTELEERTQQLHEQKAKIEALHAVAANLEACETPAEVYEELVTAAESILDFDIAIADTVEDGVLVPEAVSADLSEDEYYDETPVDDEDSAAATAYRTGDSSIVDDVTEGDGDPASVEFRSGLTVPIGEYGVFQAVDRDTAAFDETDRELAELLVGHGKAKLTQLERERELRDQTEELKRKNERLDQFASVVSHDLRNPLNVAASYVELAREETDSEYLDDASSALGRMEQLIDDLLALAREGQQATSPETLVLPDIVESCWHSVETAEATLVTEATHSVRADRHQLRRLLENLFRNSVEHGGESVTITVGDLPDGFYVADDGPGLPETDRDRLFEVGFSTSDEGTGFGLGIVAEIAKSNGWEVTATESESGGARFEVTGVELE